MVGKGQDSKHPVFVELGKWVGVARKGTGDEELCPWSDENREKLSVL